jgi:hypothetical protein
VEADKAKTPNLVLRHIREVERRETREEFAAAVVNAGRQLGDRSLGCDARLVARWEDGEVECPRAVYQRALTALTGRPLAQLGFRLRNAIELPSPIDLTRDRLSFDVDNEGQVWATMNRRRFLVSTSAALLAQAGIGQVAEPTLEAAPSDSTDSYGFARFVRERWPTLRLSRPQPDFGIDYTALLPANRPIDGAIVQIQLQGAQVSEGRAVVVMQNLLRWEDFSRCAHRGLLVAACQASERRFFAMDVRQARRRTGHHDPPTVAVPDAYELDDLTFGLLWACASLDEGLQADDQELSAALGDLAPYEDLPSSAVSREAAADLGGTSRMWLGSDFCARHILRNLGGLAAETPAFWTREQTGREACPWLLFEHKYAYLRATGSRFADGSLSRMFCMPHNAVVDSPLFERVLLLLSVALMEATGIHVKVCEDPAYSEVEGFVLGGHDRAIIANWVRGEGIWHVDTARRASVLSDFREAAGYASAHSVIDAPSPAGRLRALAGYLGVDWAWLQRRCAGLAHAGTAGLLRPRSRHMSTVGVDTACSYVAGLAAAHA